MNYIILAPSAFLPASSSSIFLPSLLIPTFPSPLYFFLALSQPTKLPSFLFCILSYLLQFYLPAFPSYFSFHLNSYFSISSIPSCLSLSLQNFLAPVLPPFLPPPSLPSCLPFLFLFPPSFLLFHLFLFSPTYLILLNFLASYFAFLPAFPSYLFPS